MRTLTDPKEIRARIKQSLRAWRQARGLTQAEAATALGVNPRTYEKYEDGTRGVSLAILARFCLVAEVDVNHLLIGRHRQL
jgi:transcriptional regulator with XRE-family HTH domain